MPIYTRRPFISPIKSQIQPEKSLVVARINEGMITDIDSVDIPEASGTLVKNARVRFDKTRRRPGLQQVGNRITEPDDKVVSFGEFITNSGARHQLMFTSSAVYELLADVWSIYTGPVLIGTRIQGVTFFNEFYFANGIDEIQKINTGALTYAAAGNAKKMKYITGFFNRIVGFNEASGDPTLIAWSADGDASEWDPTVDLSAGFASLIDSPSDRSDFGTGVFAFDNVIVVMRERSIWLGNKQPIASLPFNFYTQVPGMGCDAPHSARVFGSSIFYVDTRTRGIFIYKVGAQTPERISTGKIENEFFANLDKPSDIFSTVDTANNEYLVAYPITGTRIVRVWVFNLLTKAWSYDELNAVTAYSISALGASEPSTGSLPIDTLVGSIDLLTGTIDGLVSSETSKADILVGTSIGQVASYEESADDDIGLPFITEIVSKDFVLEEDTIYVASIRIDLSVRSPVTLTLSYSKDNGKTYITAKTQTFSETEVRSRLKFQKNIQARYLRWRCTTSNGDLTLLGYEINVSPGGDIT